MDISKIKSASILTLAIELLSETSIIKLPKGAKYSLQDTLTVLFHAATSTSNSSESTNKDYALECHWLNYVILTKYNKSGRDRNRK